MAASKKTYEVALLPMKERDEKTGKIIKTYEVGDPIDLTPEKAEYHLKHGWVVELDKERTKQDLKKEN